MTSVGILASSVLGLGFKAALGNNAATASGTTLVITTTAPIDVGDLVVVRVAADNLSATTPTFTCTDSGGNTYTSHANRGQNGTAAAGVAGGLMATKAITAVATGGTITITLSGAVAHRAAYAESFVGFQNTLRNAVNTNAGTAGTEALAITSATAGDLVCATAVIESRAAPSAFDTDTTSGSWSSAVVKPSATTGTDSTCVEVVGQNKVLTASGAQQYDLTATATDWAMLAAVFIPS